MATMRRKLRWRIRFGLGLAGGLAAIALIAPMAHADTKPTPKPGTAAGDQYAAPTVVTYVTLTAAKVGKCKLAVVKRYTPRMRACHGKRACLSRVAKTQAAAAKQCDRLARTTRPVAKPKARPTAKPTAKPGTTITINAKK
jgi:hypothetical protein